MSSPSLPPTSISHSPPRSPHNIRIYIITLLASLGSWMFGYNNGVISGVLVLPSFITSFNLPPLNTPEYDDKVANIVSLFQVGGLVGSVAMFGFMKVLGRKGCLAGAGGVYVLGGALQTFSNGSLPQIYAGRLIAGIGTGSITVLVPLYIAELSPPSIRGSLVGIYEINNQLSSVIGYWGNYIVNEYIPSSPRQWKIALGMQIIPSSLLILAALLVLPETPRYLMRKGKLEKARKILARVRKAPVDDALISEELEEIQEAIEVQNLVREVEGAGKGPLRRFTGLCRELTWKGNRNRVSIGVGLMVGQNMTGINGVNFYTPYVFKSIGFGGTRVGLLASGMFAVVKAIATILSLVFLVDRLGRRKLLLTSSVGAGLSLWYIGAFVQAKNIDMNQSQEKSVAGWVAIVCVYIYAAFFSFAWNGVVWIYCAEIFPTRIKDLAICLTTAVQWSGQFAVARATPTMVSNMRGGFFLFFASCITIMLICVYIFVPETKGMTLEAMDEVFGSAYADREGVVDLELQRYRMDVIGSGGGKGIIGKDNDGEMGAGGTGGNISGNEVQVVEDRRSLEFVGKRFVNTVGGKHNSDG